ncbi:MAG: ketoacyl-ACP synthase III [Candidatus Cloacimonetes bacterium]|nr:ketoacyl-ACP synthase III [Candidatus Cloacimonadota bacterium]MCF7815112.1 ketoacyl-ACP synthase III [Candidatus Cloacimonadota bacterium]MCF7868609.1 ketoacyl-ACP synthase III [Candidatus Cloacimonadota bacterium]MCF7882838.1 ketoacyl-ACP synthase III [Candidatus Cloacimonadota bacterium]
MIAKYNAKISGTGHYVPDKILNNFDLEKIVDTTDEWIRTRTGMFERHIAADDQAVSDLSYEAAQLALESAGIKAKDLDMIIIASVSNDHMFPSTACILQKMLGIKNIPAFDISAGCTGWIYGSNIAKQYIENGIAKHILVIGVEILSKITNWEDRGTCVLFGDGAGATIISRSENKDISRFIDSKITADGTYYDLLIQQAGGSRMPASKESVEKNLHTVYMEGNKIFKQAVKSMYSACDTVLKRNNMNIKSIDWLITHQANLRIIEALGKKLRIDNDKVIVNIEKYANTSAATIPIALDEVIRNGKVRHGDIILTASFGAGLTSGSLLFRL